MQTLCKQRALCWGIIIIFRGRCMGNGRWLVQAAQSEGGGFATHHQQQHKQRMHQSDTFPPPPFIPPHPHDAATSFSSPLARTELGDANNPIASSILRSFVRPSFAPTNLYLPHSSGCGWVLGGLLHTVHKSALHPLSTSTV